MPLENTQAWMLSYLPLFRLTLFFCCFAYCVVLYQWLKPSGREMSAAIMASWVQFSIGVLLDTQIVCLGFWVYRPMDFSLAGVPLDLHLDWTLIWGFGLVWLYSRWQLFHKGTGATMTYLLGWVVLTLAFDSVSGRHLPFLSASSSLWWIVDALFLYFVLGVTLWVYHGILYPPVSAVWLRWSCRVRSVLYVSSLLFVFYIYLPGVVLSLTQGRDVQPLLGLQDWRMLGLMVMPSFLLGAWAILHFADQGSGTPLPLDPPVRLVTSGPYAFVRNPMQIAGMLLALVLVLYYPTLFMVAYVVDMALVAVVLMNLFERSQLEQSFGSPYKEYAREVRNWIPRAVPLTTIPVGHNP